MAVFACQGGLAAPLQRVCEFFDLHFELGNLLARIVTHADIHWGGQWKASSLQAVRRTAIA
jgi:hypothetical protein